MRLLLDTHALLWYADSSPQLSRHAGALLADPTNDLFLSTATVWELAIKVGLRKLALSGPFSAYLTTAIHGYSIKVLPISIDDCASYVALPFPTLAHRDPFDRLMVVHAKSNGLAVVSADAAFDSYGINRLW